MSSTKYLIGKGVCLGILHVLTGPQYLSALITLSTNEKCRAFSLGIRWGMGHSIGLVVLASIAISLDDYSGEDFTIGVPDMIAIMGEIFVGISLLLLGSYSLVKVQNKRRSEEMEEEMMHTMMENFAFVDNRSDHSRSSFTDFNKETMSRRDSNESLPDGFTTISLSRSPSTASLKTSRSNTSDRRKLKRAKSALSLPDGEDPTLRPSVIVEIDQGPPVPFTIGESCLSLADAAEIFCSKSVQGETSIDHFEEDSGMTRGFLSFCVGIVHGAGCLKSVLGVVPAFQLHDPKLSVVYLGTFCIASLIAMAIFAVLFGFCSARISASSRRAEYRMEVCSSLASILVGCPWLALVLLRNQTRE